MFGWFRKRASPDAVGKAVGEMCGASLQVIRSFSNDGVFTESEVSTILETFPQAMHALALQHMKFDLNRAIMSDDHQSALAPVDRLYDRSKLALIATGTTSNDPQAAVWLDKWELDQTVISALDVTSHASELELSKYDKDFIVWSYFTKYWLFDEEGRSDRDRELQISRSHRLSVLGKFARQALEQA